MTGSDFQDGSEAILQERTCLSEGIIKYPFQTQLFNHYFSVLDPLC